MHKTASPKGKQPADQNEVHDENSRPYLSQNSGVSQAPDQTVTPYKSIIADKLVNKFPVQQPPKHPYKETITILFCWQEDLELYGKLITQLCNVLYHKYGSAICDLYKIQHSPSSHAKVCEYMESVIREHSHHETLIVIYYIGGATTSKDGKDGLSWFPLK